MHVLYVLRLGTSLLCLPASQSPSELGDDIDAKAVGSKLVLLTLHFPRLRLVWSRR
jgi:hypothetical protein